MASVAAFLLLLACFDVIVAETQSTDAAEHPSARHFLQGHEEQHDGHSLTERDPESQQAHSGKAGAAKPRQNHKEKKRSFASTKHGADSQHEEGKDEARRLKNAEKHDDGEKAAHHTNNAEKQPHDAELPDTFQEAAGLATKMPYYGALLLYPLKFTITVFAVGAERTDKPKSLIGQALLWVTLFLFILTLFFDLCRMRRVIRNPSFSGWEKMNLIILICSLSPNHTTAASFFGIWSLFVQKAKWNKAHNLMGSDADQLLQKALPGCLGYVPNMGFFFLALVSFPVVIYCVPTFLAYFYLSIPVMCLFCMIGLAAAQWVLISARWKNSDAASLTEPDEGAWRSLAAQKLIAGTYEYDEYVEDIEVVQLTGAQQKSWYDYVVLPLMMLAMPLFTTLAARLYSGHGYWAALTDTLGERHLAVYLQSLIDTAVDAAGEVESYEIPGAQGAMRLVQRWLACLSYAV